MLRSVFVIVVLLALSSVATAHPLDLGYMRITPNGDRFAIQLDIEIGAAAMVLGTEAASLDAATIAKRANDLAAATYQRAAIASNNNACLWQPGAAASLSNRTVTITSSALCTSNGAPFRWSFPFVTEKIVSSRFQLMVKQGVGDSESLTMLDSTSAELELMNSSIGANTSAGQGVGFTGFVWSGIQHIGVTRDQWQADSGSLKLPDGIDHILFLIALLLGGGTLLQLFGLATGFTVGHSITLALAAFDIVRPPPSIIEPLIALSISLAAVEAFTGKWKQHRWKIATFFGLIHGFGFATALSHLDLTTGGRVTALFGYNLGVELGQVVIVLLFAPLVILAHRRWRHGKLAIKITAGLVFICGMYWFIERISG
jgi:hypothetical protein